MHMISSMPPALLGEGSKSYSVLHIVQSRLGARHLDLGNASNAQRIGRTVFEWCED